MTVEEIIKNQIEIYKKLSEEMGVGKIKTYSENEILSVYDQVNRDIRTASIQESREKKESEPATDKQISFMDKHKIEYSKDITKKQAGDLIGKEIESWQK